MGRFTMMVVLALTGCETEPDTTPDGPLLDDTGAVAGDLCAEAPVTTYDNFGAGFVTENCQPCHASTSVDRRGAPAEITFDSEADVLALSDRVLDRATGAEPTMPPLGGPNDDDRYLLEVWLTCSE